MHLAETASSLIESVCYHRLTVLCYYLVKAQGFTCGPGHQYERVVLNMGPDSTESWAAGVGFVGCSRCTEGAYLALDGDLTGTRVEKITKGARVAKVRLEDERLRRLHDQTEHECRGEAYEDLVDWALEYIDQNRPPVVPRVDSVEPPVTVRGGSQASQTHDVCMEVETQGTDRTP